MVIENFRCENSDGNIVTDNKNPIFTYKVNADGAEKVAGAEIEVNGELLDATNQPRVRYSGKALKPDSSYSAVLRVRSGSGEVAERALKFGTGKFGQKWIGKWITDGSYKFRLKKTSPEPITFKKEFNLKKPVASVKLYCTAIGIYKAEINGEKIGDSFFAPGFTSYKNQLQYQVYDITEKLRQSNGLIITVVGGWAVGAFVMSRKNRITADRQALLAELRITYTDGATEVIGSDTGWQVSRDQNLRFAEFYDGEIYDAGRSLNPMNWRNAAIEKVRIKPQIMADYGAPVKAHEVFKAKSCVKHGDELIYDFGQNLAGVVKITVNGKAGQRIVIRHAEVLNEDGGLNTAFLRTAKCRLEYICREGRQTYMPEFTYMGFRYAGVSGVSEDDIEIESVALYSDVEEIGRFECSDERINKLQSNIVWSGKSNFVDIPTDCPQRDERMGWTGDIALFARTACFNFDMTRFLNKWLKDLRSEQTRGGGIPNTIPCQGYGFPETMPKKAVAFWGDACVFVPWALYLLNGDKNILAENYAVMKKYVKACKFWANIGIGKRRYIWNDLAMMQFGDWVAPDVPKMSQWQKRCKWTGTASFAATSGLLSRIADILGKSRDARYYKKLNGKINDAYVKVLTDGKGKLREEFQTAYVLPLYFGMFPESQRAAAVENLVALIEKNRYCIGTGFPGTPYILFALSDNGRSDVAYKMLTNTKCPSWLYEVESGATTVWERWDGLDPDGVCRIGNDGTGGMISFNHYGFGSVGDFLYRRIAGIEAEEGGYKQFRIAPVPGGGLTYAKGEIKTPYGKISSFWKTDSGKFILQIEVPADTECRVEMPSGEKHTVHGGKYEFECNL